MTSDLDIFRSANVLIREHGEGAPIVAAREANAFLARSNRTGESLWLLIMTAAKTLLAEDRSPEATVQ